MVDGKKKNFVVLFSGTRLTIGSLFKRAILESVYQNVTRIGKNEGISVFISVPSLVKGAVVKKALTYQRGWKKVNNVQADYIFDKLTYETYGGRRKQIIRKISKNIKVINDPDVSLICDNKFIAYKTFSHVSPQTFDVTKKNFREVVKKIRSRMIVFKPWYGSGGKGIVIKEKSQARPSDIGRQYIAQEYIDTRGGIKGVSHPNTLRFIILNGKTILVTLETAKTGEIVSGNVKAVTIRRENIPFGTIKKILNEVDSVFRHYYPRLYSVDFSISKKDIFIGEINSKPGLFPSEGEKQEDYDVLISKFFRSLH